MISTAYIDCLSTNVRLRCCNKCPRDIGNVCKIARLSAVSNNSEGLSIQLLSKKYSKYSSISTSCAVGGVVGGVSAFPGSALVVWNGLLGVTKAKSRALTQPYIIFMQIVGLWMTLWFYPKAFDPLLWTVLMFALPIALLGTHVGVQIYKKTGDIGYRKFTFVALGVSGLGLLMKMALVTS